MAIEKNVNSRIQHKHDIEANWIKAVNFIPKDGELIIYDPDSVCAYTRLKVGNGTTKVTDLPFFIDYAAARADYVNTVFNTYILNIDYENTLGFDPAQDSFSSLLGEGIVGAMILGL